MAQSEEPRGQELTDRYKKNYSIPIDAEVTEEMILAHWGLEKRLAQELLESNPEDRWEIFERCYSTLYGELEWLNCLIGTDITLPISQRYRDIARLIGQPPKRIYEVGSGKGEMIAYLANCGFECKATEVTRERGQKFVSHQQNLSWGISDGVHLDKFEPQNSYDVVLSNQLIEHLHPDDVLEHFKGVLSILSKGGRYIFVTPHKYVGPSDISRVFNCDKPMGMHLKEYTYAELKELLTRAGFKNILAALRIPPKIIDFTGRVVKPRTISHLLGWVVEPRSSRTYLAFLLVVEKLISLLSHHGFRRKVARPFSGMFIIAQKNKLGKC